MDILVGCEESGTVRNAFAARGHNAWSCDLQEARDMSEKHIIGDVKEAIRRRKWDLIILHPPCTALALSGNRHYGVGKPRHEERIEAIDWTCHLLWLAMRQAKAVCMENPASVIFPVIRDEWPGVDVQYIQPWEYGHGETKKTGLALYNLPRLKPTDVVDGRSDRIWKMGPSPWRAKERSVTYKGIAEAMAEQWSKI